MVPEMQLVVTENQKIIKKVHNETNTPGSHFMQSLREFQQLVNAALTQMIEERGGSNQSDNEDLNEESSENEEDGIPVTPKKKRK